MRRSSISSAPRTETGLKVKTILGRNETGMKFGDKEMNQLMVRCFHGDWNYTV